MAPKSIQRAWSGKTRRRHYVAKAVPPARGPECGRCALPPTIPSVGPPCHHLFMKPPKPFAMPNSETENRAIAYVIAQERSAGRTAVDVHKTKGSLVDVESVDDATGEKRLIEIKAFGGAGRGDFLWLESNQVKALEQVSGSHLYIVTNVKSPERDAIRVLDLTGEQLRERLAAKREKHYYEVPLPVAVYDDLLAKALVAHSPTGDDVQDDVDSVTD